MKELNAEIVSTLDELVSLNLDSEMGFETAAEHAREPALKTRLRDFARQRARFAEELRAEIIGWGGTPQQRRNPMAALHRGWIDLKAGLTVGRRGSCCLKACAASAMPCSATRAHLSDCCRWP
ncbi:MAG: PA2169 family four-helix-bundle protein [Caldilinea sp.]|jgi:uncharacterized protein (TIGR02284 family)